MWNYRSPYNVHRPRAKNIVGKRVPDYIKDNNDSEVLYALLAGVLDGDGTITITFRRTGNFTVRIFLYTHDDKLAEDLLLVIRKLGHSAYRRRYRQNGNEIYIVSKGEVFEFLSKTINFMRHPIKREKAALAIGLLTGKIDVELGKKIWNELKVKSRKSAYEWYVEHILRKPATPS